MSSQLTKELEALEYILSDPSKEPVKLSYPTIVTITHEFSIEIGRGGFGVVYLGTLRSGKIAVKKLSNAQDFDDALFTDEINCLLKTKHKNIVRFLGYCAHTHGEMVEYKGRYILADVRQRVLCFEFVPNGNLYDYLKEKPNKDEWQMRYQMIKEICQGLHYLHGRRINHLDLKQENVLIDIQMNPKITDFGLSRCFDEGQSRVFTQNVRGTRGYIAPEIIDKGEISFKSDIFSLGIIIIKLLTGSNSYDTKNWHETLDVDDPQAKSCIQIAHMCTHTDQHKRPSIGEIIDELNAMESMIQESKKDTFFLQREYIDIEKIPVTPDLYINVMSRASHDTNDACNQNNKKQNQKQKKHVPDKATRHSKMKDTWSSIKKFFSPTKYLYEEEEAMSTNYGNDGDSLWLFEKRQFTYEELAMITNGFHRVLGRGGFGYVYYGLLEDDTQVVVKVRSPFSVQGTKEFLAAAQLSARVQHKNLVSMIGYCKEGEHMALVYEYIPQGTLQEHIAGTNCSGNLSRRQRLRIAHESAQVLEYLHNGCSSLPLIHRDVNTTSILLNARLEAKITGLSSAIDQHDGDDDYTVDIFGTPGYLDPEYYTTMQPTTKSDVYSFGVVLLELVTGNPAILLDPEPMSIITWTRQRLEQGNIKSVVDARMDGGYDINSMWKVADIALKCTAPASAQRPTMTHVLAQLLDCILLEEGRGE